MKIENATVTLRQRGGFEALDLGCALARTYWLRSVTALTIVLAPVALLLNFAAAREPWLALVVVW